MRLRDLLQDVPTESITGSLDVEIREVRDDSRAVGEGDLFVALPGRTVDGHDYLEEVARRGAVAVLIEKDVPDARFPGTRVRVSSTRRALATVASHRFGDAWRAMKMVAITGTNGKTTTTFLIESILATFGARPGVLGTVNYRYAGKTFAAPFTTPTALELHAILADMLAAGCTHVVMEASSHALALDRLAGIEFRVGAFTNLTQDHLDFHRTMEEYFKAKALLMRRGLRQSDGVGLVFVDDAYGPRMAKEVVGDRLLISLTRDGADLYPKSFACTIDGIVAELASPMGPIKIKSRLIGQYNLANIAVAAGAAVALGVPVLQIEQGVAQLTGVPGRVERVTGDGAKFAVLVDYAHTHDALENVIGALRPLTAGRLLCVFGCGGDRDRSKRPRMGKAVARDADLAIVTSDNPRTEEPGAIIDMILEGVAEIAPPRLDAGQLATAPRGYYVDPDRRAAIEAVVAAAQQGDVILIAGKGHEDYQIIGTTKYPFDDRLIAREALSRRGTP